jgi:hypothetical protein
MDEALDGLEAFLHDADRQLDRLLDGNADQEVMVPVLARLRVLRRRLGQVEALAERDVAHSLGIGKRVIAGLPLDVHGGWKRTDWQHREIGRLLAESVFVDEETGELDQIGLMAAMPAVYRVLDACRPEWRVTDLKAAGLTTDGLCKEEPARMTVQFLTPAETKP